MNDNMPQCANDNKSACMWSSLSWWATLVVAVLAVPAIGIVAATMAGADNAVQIIVFVIACWVCTWLGMRIMQNPSVQDKLKIKK